MSVLAAWTIDAVLCFTNQRLFEPAWLLRQTARVFRARAKGRGCENIHFSP